jgi:uncharacterized membrane protein YphA (DoxX/SURF4 family)
MTMDPAIQLALRLAFALLLGAAASHKLRDLARFREVLRAYELLPDAAVSAAAVAVAGAELLLSSALLLGSNAAGGAVVVLMLAYAGAIQSNVMRGRTDIDCGCMGPAARVPLGTGLVLRNVLLAAAASLLLVPASPREMGVADVASAVAATAVLSACWLATERMLALAPRAAKLRAQRRPQ